MTKIKHYKWIAMTVSLFAAPTAFAWGQYGHEQVNYAAMQLLPKDSGLATCFQSAPNLILRYAITPDIEWKLNLPLKNPSVRDRSARHDDDCYEHPLHFFEADAFDPSGANVTQLPSGPRYADIFPLYAKLLSANAGYVAQVDPSKALSDPKNPSAKDVALHGTAPWRIRSLYLTAIDFMSGQNNTKNNPQKIVDFKRATFYLATMGHYVGDMSQPFHAALNFDGDYRPQDEQAGIHHEIDTGLLEDFIKPSNKDSQDVFTSFDKTNAAVMASAQARMRQYPKTFSDKDIVPAVLRMVQEGFPSVNSMLQIYQAECRDANQKGAKKDRKQSRKVAAALSDNPTRLNGDHGHVPIAADSPRAAMVANKRFCVPIELGGISSVRAIGVARETQMSGTAPPNDVTVIEKIEQRLGASAALLVELWLSAYQQAGSPAIGSCKDWAFDQSYAMANYPRPDYYPSAFDGTTKPGCQGPMVNR